MDQDAHAYLEALERAASARHKIVSAEIDPESEFAALEDRIEDDVRLPGVRAEGFARAPES